MTHFSASGAKSRAVRHDVSAFDWKNASKASICAFMLAFAPLTVAMAQSADDDSYIAPAEPAPAAADDSSDDIAAPAAPAAAAPAAAVPAAASASVPGSANAGARSLQDITVTGSSFSGTDAATALPVTSYSVEQLKQQGITSTAQVLTQLPTNNGDTGVGFGTGGYETGGAVQADLRGLGPGHTLVLLDGRRLAVDPLYGSAVNVNSIPFSALERVEVLRDGASALYGTDAVAGVINFITKKSYDGGTISGTYETPTRDGGGDTRTLEFTLGHGDLNKDRYNVMVSGNWRHVDPISSNDRPGIVKSYLPGKGVNRVSSYGYPANYLVNGSPSLNPLSPDGCPGGLIVDTGDTACHFDYTQYGQVQQKRDDGTLLARGTYKIDDNNKVAATYLFTHNEYISQTSPGLTSGGPELSPTSKFYPGNGIVPDNFNIKQYYDDPNQRDPINLLYYNAPGGARTEKSVNETHNAVLNFTGLAYTIHYDTAFGYSQSNLTQTYTNGYFDPNVLVKAFNDGIINPFSTDPLSAAGRQAEADARVTGQLQASKSREYFWDGKVDREIGDWFGQGESQLALGAQYRHDTISQKIDNRLAIATQASGGAFSPTDPIDEDRDIESVYGDLNVPLLNTDIKGLESLTLDAQARYDNYSDVGDTLNPKVSLRFQPIQQVLIRGSYGEGFSAPTLYDLYGATSQTFTQAGLNDPKYCDGDGNPIDGAPGRSCNQQFVDYNSGNKNLDPETSRQWTAGIVIEPIDKMSLGVDFWWIELSNQVKTLPGRYILANADQYQDLIIRDENTNAIDHIVSPLANLGKTETHGIDFTADYAVPTAAFGTFSVSYQGTYTQKYDYQNVPNGEYKSALGQFADINLVIPRYKHSASLRWNRGPIGAQVTNNFTSGYKDFDPETNKSVNDYMTWDMSASYSWQDGVQLTLGSRNIGDTDPPFSNQPIFGQPGYNSLYSDAIGRTVFAKLSYEF